MYYYYYYYYYYKYRQNNSPDIRKTIINKLALKTAVANLHYLQFFLNHINFLYFNILIK